MMSVFRQKRKKARNISQRIGRELLVLGEVDSCILKLYINLKVYVNMDVTGQQYLSWLAPRAKRSARTFTSTTRGSLRWKDLLTNTEGRRWGKIPTILMLVPVTAARVVPFPFRQNYSALRWGISTCGRSLHLAQVFCD